MYFEPCHFRTRPPWLTRWVWGASKDTARSRSARKSRKTLITTFCPTETAAVKTRLAELRLNLTAYHMDSIPADENARRTLFAFAKDLGVETTPTLFATPALAQMMLGAIQFVLGDLPMDTTPSALLGTK